MVFSPKASGWDIDEDARFECAPAKIAVEGSLPHAPWSLPGETARLYRIASNSDRVRRYCESLEKRAVRQNDARFQAKIHQRKRYFKNLGRKFKMEALFQKRRFAHAPPSYKKRSIYDSSDIY